MQATATGAQIRKAALHKQQKSKQPGAMFPGRQAFRSMIRRMGRPKSSNPTKIPLPAWAGAEGSPRGRWRSICRQTPSPKQPSIR